MEIFKTKQPINLMGKKIHFFVISLILIIVSIFSVATKGLNFGVDFAGGTIIQVKYDKPVDLEVIRNSLKSANQFKISSVTYFGNDDEVVIKMSASTSSMTNDVGDVVKQILSKTGNFEIRRVDMVGPKVGDELTNKGIMALSLGMIAILIYVGFRFEWRFAVGSVVALFHDITIAIGAISLFQIEVNLDILAALLTLLGYSINDTIIVFDRIRESVQKTNQRELNDLINESVTQTLSRTTLTSLTTFFVVLTLYLFGGEIINGFSFTLLVGLIVGTYSSIFVASPLLLLFGFNITDYRAKQVEKLKKEQEKARMRAMFEKGTV